MRRIFSAYIAVVVVAVFLLATGLKVYSAVAPPPGRSLNHKALSRIDRDRRDLHFAVFGDNQSSSTTFNRLVDSVNSRNVLFSLANGDMVMDGDMEKYRMFLRQADGLRRPLLTNIGNHEIAANGRGTYYDIFGPFYYSFTLGDSYFIVVDDASRLRLEPFQMDWLKGELRRSRAYANRFVFMHVPLFDTRKTGFGLDHEMKDRAAAGELNRLFDAYHVTMIFASHIHEYQTGIWGKTPYIITGGAGGQLAGTDSRHYFFHYIDVHVSPSGVSYDVVKLPTPRFSVLDRVIHDTWLYIYAFLVSHYLDLVIVMAGAYLLLFAIFFLERRGMKRRPGEMSDPRD